MISLPPGARSGPVSRLVRLLLGVFLGFGALDLWTADPAGWAMADTAAEPGVWIVTLIMFIGVPDVVETVSGRPWGRRGQVLVVAAAGAAAVVALVTSGGLWASPFSWLVYGLDLALLTVVSIAMVVSMVLGTPGCEMGALVELSRRGRGNYDPDHPSFRPCVAFLHRLDAWEAKQPWRVDSRRGNGSPIDPSTDEPESNKTAQDNSPQTENPVNDSRR